MLVPCKSKHRVGALTPFITPATQRQYDRGRSGLRGQLVEGRCEAHLPCCGRALYKVPIHPCLADKCRAPWARISHAEKEQLRLGNLKGKEGLSAIPRQAAITQLDQSGQSAVIYNLRSMQATVQRGHAVSRSQRGLLQIRTHFDTSVEQVPGLDEEEDDDFANICLEAGGFEDDDLTSAGQAKHEQPGTSGPVQLNPACQSPHQLYIVRSDSPLQVQLAQAY